MASTLKRLAQNQAHCSITLSAEETTAAMNRAIEKLGRSVRVPGFREGHAPVDVIKEKIGEDAIWDQTIRDVLPAVFKEMVQTHNLKPIAPPRVEVIAREPLTLNVTFVETPEVTIKGFDKIRIEKKPVKADDKDVERMVQYLLQQHRHTHEVEREAKHGDQVTIDFHGTDKEGTEIPGIRSTGYQVEIGSKTLLPGFEDALIGMGKGHKKSFELVFPEKYHAEHLRNKPVTFHTTLAKVEEVHMPALTDDFVKEKGLGESEADLRARIRESMTREEEMLDQRRRENDLFDAIRKATHVSLAPELVEFEEQNIARELQDQLKQQNLTIDAWLKQTKRTPESLTKELKEEATKRLTLRFGIEKVLEKQKIDLSEEEMLAAIKDVVAQLPENERINAAAAYQTGTQEYDQLKWQKRIEKMATGVLSR